MKASELRIGNLVLNDAVVNSIAVIGAEYPALKTPQWNYIHAKYELIKPIQLTEEWLLKFGFKKNEDYDFEERIFNEYFFPEDWQLWSIGSFNNKGYVIEEFDNPPLQYVHQLQNLYFALTGEELTIKQPA